MKWVISKRICSKNYKPGDLVMYFNNFYTIIEKCNDINTGSGYDAYRIRALDGTFGGAVSEYFLIDMRQGI